MKVFHHDRALWVYDILTTSVSETGASLDAIRCMCTLIDSFHVRICILHSKQFPFIVATAWTRSLYNTMKLSLWNILEFRCNSLLRYQSTPGETG